ncbi:hypothetical protein DM02DRAFT_633335 [Periconia macrospinosa]|uniref:Uncharacterized protein n=1 Tax=Periconia macrospinosa TaxID=97972 RepID=A0A2V1DA10_9PLEO|nr:hypothetical protein DM02DRAFT_633335 [Periconia macrospinosa]
MSQPEQACTHEELTHLVEALQAEKADLIAKSQSSEVQTNQLLLQIHEKNAHILALENRIVHLETGEDESEFQDTALKFCSSSEREKILLDDYMKLKNTTASERESKLEQEIAVVVEQKDRLADENAEFKNRVADLEAKMASMAINNMQGCHVLNDLNISRRYSIH